MAHIVNIAAADAQQTVAPIVATTSSSGNNNGYTAEVFTPVMIEPLEGVEFGFGHNAVVESKVFQADSLNDGVVYNKVTATDPGRWCTFWSYGAPLSGIGFLGLLIAAVVTAPRYSYSGVWIMLVVLSCAAGIFFINASVMSTCCCGNKGSAKEPLISNRTLNGHRPSEKNCCCNCAYLYAFLANQEHIKTQEDLDQYFNKRAAATPKLKWNMDCHHGEKDQGSVTTHVAEEIVPFDSVVSSSGMLEGLNVKQQRLLFAEWSTKLSIMDEETFREIERRRTQFVQANCRDVENTFTEMVVYPDMEPRVLTVLGNEPPQNWFRKVFFMTCFFLGPCVRCHLSRNSHSLRVLLQKQVTLSAPATVLPLTAVVVAPGANGRPSAVQGAGHVQTMEDQEHKQQHDPVSAPSPAPNTVVQEPDQHVAAMGGAVQQPQPAAATYSLAHVHPAPHQQHNQQDQRDQEQPKQATVVVAATPQFT